MFLYDLLYCSPSGSSVHGVLQARILEWVATPWPRHLLTCLCVHSLSRVWLSDPMDCSPPGSSVHGIFQARILERVAISFSRGYSCPGIKPVSLISPALTGGISRFYHWASWEASKRWQFVANIPLLQCWSSRAILSFWQCCLGAHIVEHIYLLKTLILPTF